MNHPAELALHNTSKMLLTASHLLSEETIERIGKDVMDAVRRQFGGGNKRTEFGLRMSNIGRPSCQLCLKRTNVRVLCLSQHRLS
jgi:hypothetical protein